MSSIYVSCFEYYVELLIGFFRFVCYGEKFVD